MATSSWARTASSSLHHVATGAWVASAIAVYFMHRRIGGLTGDAEAQLASQAFLVFEAMVFSLVVAFATGLGTYFVSRGRTEVTGKSGGPVGPVGRHVGYLVVSVVGTWWAFVLFLP